MSSPEISSTTPDLSQDAHGHQGNRDECERSQGITTLAVLASGSGSNLEAIAKAIEKGQLLAKIAVVIYNEPEAYVKQRADKFGIPAILINHRDYKSRAELDRAIVDILKQYHIDLVIMAGWMRIVTQVLIDAFPERILNIHPSLLPSFKGIHAIEQAFNYGVKITGCTVHILSLEVDSGRILKQAAVPILASDNLMDLQKRIQVQEHIIYPAAIAEYAQSLTK
ncbi:phosphoribosylglycinamide formyltransferase [Pseudanabaena sp. UWO310]|uniref:phosphoribosylglycinamide formyltransferase n=1 Tax=Pseudanabaena sp. UWO310 TaxID=2480795 RepID=UPI0011579688|nr:phosphoribosylglycinamide formyltransferase [Pseudanabaena sp. UWO310]TYQ31187.1 phosphoribosylglycinamide formyltransferase [Pseudanabaena sp. UWO310]